MVTKELKRRRSCVVRIEWCKLYTSYTGYRIGCWAGRAKSWKFWVRYHKENQRPHCPTVVGFLCRWLISNGQIMWAFICCWPLEPQDIHRWGSVISKLNRIARLWHDCCMSCRNWPKLKLTWSGLKVPNVTTVLIYSNLWFLEVPVLVFKSISVSLWPLSPRPKLEAMTSLLVNIRLPLLVRFANCWWLENGWKWCLLPIFVNRRRS